METKNTLSDDETIIKLKKLLRNFDKFNKNIDMYTLCIKKNFKEDEKE